MVYNHLKDKVKSFLQPFAESGQAVGAEDIKAYFEKLEGMSRRSRPRQLQVLVDQAMETTDGSRVVTNFSI